jgi:hypothetical protein
MIVYYEASIRSNLAKQNGDWRLDTFIEVSADSCSKWSPLSS